MPCCDAMVVEQNLLLCHVTETKKKTQKTKKTKEDKKGNGGSTKLKNPRILGKDYCAIFFSFCIAQN